MIIFHRKWRKRLKVTNFWRPPRGATRGLVGGRPGVAPWGRPSRQNIVLATIWGHVAILNFSRQIILLAIIWRRVAIFDFFHRTRLGESWGDLRASWGDLGVAWGCLGTVLGRSWGVLGVYVYKQLQEANCVPLFYLW